MRWKVKIEKLKKKKYVEMNEMLKNEKRGDMGSGANRETNTKGDSKTNTNGDIKTNTKRDDGRNISDWLLNTLNDDEAGDTDHERMIHNATMNQAQERFYNIGYKTGLEEGMESFDTSLHIGELDHDDLMNIVESAAENRLNNEYDTAESSLSFIQAVFNKGYEMACLVGFNYGTLMSHLDTISNCTALPSDTTETNCSISNDDFQAIKTKWSNKRSSQSNILEWIDFPTDLKDFDLIDFSNLNHASPSNISLFASKLVSNKNLINEMLIDMKLLNLSIVPFIE